MAYDRQIESAARLLAQYGAQIPMTLPPATTSHTPGTLALTPEATAPVTVTAVVLKGPRDPNATVSEGSLSRQNTRTLLIAGKGCPVAEIPAKTLFEVEGATWRALGSTRLAPDGGPAILHRVVVQRGMA